MLFFCHSFAPHWNPECCSFCHSFAPFLSRHLMMVFFVHTRSLLLLTLMVDWKIRGFQSWMEFLSAGHSGSCHPSCPIVIGLIFKRHAVRLSIPKGHRQSKSFGQDDVHQSALQPLASHTVTAPFCLWLGKPAPPSSKFKNCSLVGNNNTTNEPAKH